MKKNNIIEPMELAERICGTIMGKYSAAELPPKGRFHYHQGVFLCGVEQTYLSTGKSCYSKYIKSWINLFLCDDGEIVRCNQRVLDDKQPSNLLFRLFEEESEEKYELALRQVRESMTLWPVNRFGGFWHMLYSNKKNQMWLDGLYMIGEFLARYGAKFGDSSCFDAVILQAQLMWENMRDEKSGLLYHAWDPEKDAKWADKETGLSPHIWGRANGWYISALIIILNYIPLSRRERSMLIGYVREYIECLVRFQGDDGLWYQILDMPGAKGNWTETSCSALFLFAISNAVLSSLIDCDYMKYADKAYEGLVKRIVLHDDKTVTVPQICIGTGIGNFEYYAERPRSENDLHGVGAMLLGCNAYNKVCNMLNN